MTSLVSFSYVVIRLLRFFFANGRVPASLFQSGGISTTPVQTYVISATLIKTASVSATPVQLVRVSALMRTIYVIDFYIQQSTFSSLVLLKNLISTCPKAGFMYDPNDFTPKSNNFTPDSKNPFRHPSVGRYTC